MGVRMTWIVRALVAMGLCCAPVGAMAAVVTIDFGGLPGSNGSIFTGPYVEDGATVSATGGQVFEGHAFGNPAPSLFFIGSGSFEITSTSLFRLVSFDLTGNNGTAGFTVQGFTDAVLQFTLGGGAPANSWTNILALGGPPGPITTNRYVFTLTTQGTSGNIDNIVLNFPAVPEPTSWAMMLLGFGAIGFAMRRRPSLAAA